MSDQERKILRLAQEAACEWLNTLPTPQKAELGISGFIEKYVKESLDEQLL